jgi:hypothetical protein
MLLCHMRPVNFIEENRRITEKTEVFSPDGLSQDFGVKSECIFRTYSRNTPDGSQKTVASTLTADAITELLPG